MTPAPVAPPMRITPAASYAETTTGVRATARRDVDDDRFSVGAEASRRLRRQLGSAADASVITALRPVTKGWFRCEVHGLDRMPLPARWSSATIPVACSLWTSLSLRPACRPLWL